MAEWKCIGHECKAVDDFTAEIVFGPTLGEVDAEGDLVLPGAYGRQVVKIRGAHNWAAPSVGVAKIFEQGNEARASLLFNPSMETGREWWISVKKTFEAGLQQGWDAAFDPVEFEYGQRDGRRVRILRKIQVWEISPTLAARGEQRTLCVNCSAEFGKQHVPEPEPVAVPKACGCGRRRTGTAMLRPCSRN